MSDEAKVLHEFSDGDKRRYRLCDNMVYLESYDGGEWFQPCADEDFGSAAADEIVRLVSSRRWIPVSERLPEQGVPVLALCHDGGHQFQSACYWHGGWRAAESGAPCDAVKITHWQPLPEPPKP